METVIVVDYDPRWPLVFEELRAPIARVLDGLAQTIEHVGSTSVPGLAAKPIIDMDVIVPNVDCVPTVIDRLATIGYDHRGDLGIVGREAFRAPDELPDHHLYVCVRGCLALNNHLGVRDYLRSNPAAVAEYARLKRELADAHTRDIDGYIEGKSAFLRSVLEAVGLAEDDLDAITDANRRPE